MSIPKADAKLFLEIVSSLLLSPFIHPFNISPAPVLTSPFIASTFSYLLHVDPPFLP